MLLGFPVVSIANKEVDETRLTSKNIKSITILTDHSLIVPLNLLARDYSRKQKMSVTTNIGDTPAHIAAIELGAEANLVITPKEQWIADLQQKGLIDVYSRTPIAHNRIVLAGARTMMVPKSLNKDTSLRDLTQHPLEFMINFGNPENNAEGGFGLSVLRRIGLLGQFEPHYHFFGSMYDMMETLEAPEAIGFIYRSEALLFPNVRILQRFERDIAPPVSYEAVVIAGENMEEAREFIIYLQSDYAQNIFKQYGFDTVF